MQFIFKFIPLLLIYVTLSTKAQDSPVFTLGSVSTKRSAAALPLTAIGFSNISSGNLKVIYDPAAVVPLVVTKGPDLAGTFAYNLADTGIIRIGWFTYPPVTLSDSSVIFFIEFTKVKNGTSIISFDDGTISPVDCQFNNGSHQKLNDEPFSSYYLPGSLTFNEPAGPVTKAPALTASLNENISVPITVTGFNNVGSVSLIMEYDPAVLDFNSAENTGGFPGLTIGNPNPGNITVSGTFNDNNGYSITDETTLFTLNFRYLGGTTTLSWNDNNGRSCEYSGPLSSFVFTDTPQYEYYISGKVEQSVVPDAPIVILTHPSCDVSTGTIEVTSPIGEEYKYSIDGTNYQSSPAFNDLFTGTYNITVMNDKGYVSSVTTAVLEKQPQTPVSPALLITPATCETMSSVAITNYNPAYIYIFYPEGPVVGSDGKITGFTTGQDYTVTATGNDGCESAASEPFTAEDRLEALVPEIASEHSEDGKVILTATEAENYLWSTGETTRSIVAITAGEYAVEVIYANGCSAVSPPVSIIISSLSYPEAADNRVKVKAYPNPFFERLRIEFCAPESGRARLEICDMNGRLLKTLMNCHVETGRIYSSDFRPENQSDNCYIYKLTVGEYIHSGIITYKSIKY